MLDESHLYLLSHSYHGTQKLPASTLHSIVDHAMEKEAVMEKEEVFLPPAPASWHGRILDWFMSSRSLQQFFALYKKNGAVFSVRARSWPQLRECNALLT